MQSANANLPTLGPSIDSTSHIRELPLSSHGKRAGRRRHIGTLAVMAVALASCSSSPADAPPPTISPARAAVSPAVVGTPDGVVRPLPGPGISAVFDGATRSLVVLGRDGGGRSVISVLSTPSSGRSVPLPAEATAITGDDRGMAYLSTRGGYFRFDVASGAVSPVDITDEHDTDFTAIARRADGTLVLGSADGSVYTLGGDADVAQPPAPLRSRRCPCRTG